jgi:hypothetical protein
MLRKIINSLVLRQFLKGIPFGQAFTQFWELPHSCKPPALIKASNRSSCPNVTQNNKFVGAQAISQVRLFDLHPTGAMTKDEEWFKHMECCFSVHSCDRSCQRNTFRTSIYTVLRTKGIPLTTSIAAMNRETTFHMFKSFFGSDHKVDYLNIWNVVSLFIAAIEVVKGIPFGQAFTQFWELPHSYVTQNNKFVGAQAISQVRLFDLHPTGAMTKDERLKEYLSDKHLHSFENYHILANRQHSLKRLIVRL